MNTRIADGSRVTLRCRVTDEAGQVLDEGARPLVFVCGRHQLIAGLEEKLQAKEPGFQGRIELSPQEAYGPYRKELVFEAVRENLPADLDIQPGMVLSPGGSGGKFALRVLSLTDRGAMLDGNHRLAGKHLTFDVEVLSVEPAAGTSDASS
ncbi:MAG: FKBP-type peptidyl-prolyl cis-trans isomerase [Burkholderiales bacterium]|nr:FKBP-type peptidyl-prolyl cis-trans isomerase [Burkholderiales bacterium]